MISVFRRECSRRLVATTHRQDLGLPAVGDTRSARPSAALSRSRLPDGVRGPGVRGPGGRGAAARARRRVPRPRPLLRARVRSRRRRPRRWPRRWRPRTRPRRRQGRAHAPPGQGEAPPHVLAAVEEKARLRRLDERAHFVAEVEAARTGVGGAPSHGRCLPDAEEDLFPHLFLGDDATDARSPDQDRNTAASVSSSSSATAATRAAELAEAYDDIPVEVADPALEDPEIRRLVLGGHRGDFFSEEDDDDDHAAAASGAPPLDPVEPFPVGPPGIRALREAVRDKKVALEKTKTFAAATNPRPREEEEEEPPGGSVPDAPSAAFDQLAETLSRRLAHAALTPAQRHAIPLALAGRDLVCSAATGSGKTLAYLVPAVVRALEAERAAREDEDAAPSGDAEEEGDPGPTFDPPPLVEEDDDAFAVFGGRRGHLRGRRLRGRFRGSLGGVRVRLGRRRVRQAQARARPGGDPPRGAFEPPGRTEPARGTRSRRRKRRRGRIRIRRRLSRRLSRRLPALVVTPPPARPSVLILVPTRELATRVSLQARRVAFGTGLRVATLHGAQSVKPQLEQLARAAPSSSARRGERSPAPWTNPTSTSRASRRSCWTRRTRWWTWDSRRRWRRFYETRASQDPRAPPPPGGDGKSRRREKKKRTTAAGLRVVSLRSSPTTGRGHGVSTPSGGVASSFARRFDGRQTLLFSATFPRGVLRLAAEAQDLERRGGRPPITPSHLAALSAALAAFLPLPPRAFASVASGRRPPRSNNGSSSRPRRFASVSSTSCWRRSSPSPTPGPWCFARGRAPPRGSARRSRASPRRKRGGPGRGPA